MNQMVTEVKPIPKLFILNKPIRRKLTSPRNPTSINAMEGITASAKKNYAHYRNNDGGCYLYTKEIKHNNVLKQEHTVP